MARYCTYLIAFLILWGLFSPQTARAQGGNCPDGLVELSPIMTGTYPNSIKLCTEADHGVGTSVELVSGQYIPCDSALAMRSILFTRWNAHPEFTFVLPPSLNFPSGSARIRYEFAALDWDNNSYPQFSEHGLSLVIRSFSPDRQLLQTVWSSPGRSTVTRATGLRWYFMDDLIVAEPNGYITIQVRQPERLHVAHYMIASLQIDDSHRWLPEYCPIPDATMPHTPTPPPVITITPSPPPSGTNTPTPTGTILPPTATALPTITPTRWPTAVGGTQQPQPTSTAYQPIEVSPEPAGTALPVVSLPDPSMPNVSWPGVPTMGSPEPINVGLTPNATSQARVDTIQGWVDDAEITSGAWSSSTNQALGWLDPDVSSTTGISTPVQIADTITTNIYAPFSYVRAVAVYMPSIWPYVLAILLMFIWIFINLLIKYGLAIVSETLEIIRKIIEVIPFVE